MGSVLLLRHGETEWSLTGRHTGLTDVPLTDEGRRVAASLEARLAPLEPVLVLASPLARARETAEIVAEALGLPVERRPALREVDVGSWQGLTRDEVEEGEELHQEYEEERAESRSRRRRRDDDDD